MPQPEVTLTPNAVAVFARYLQTDATGHVVETPGEMFRRVATHVAAVEEQSGGCPEFVTDAFDDAMVRLEDASQAGARAHRSAGLCPDCRTALEFSEGPTLCRGSGFSIGA